MAAPPNGNHPQQPDATARQELRPVAVAARRTDGHSFGTSEAAPSWKRNSSPKKKNLSKNKIKQRNRTIDHPRIESKQRGDEIQSLPTKITRIRRDRCRIHAAVASFTDILAAADRPRTTARSRRRSLVRRWPLPPFLLSWPFVAAAASLTRSMVSSVKKDREMKMRKDRGVEVK
ncbi:hypothetical protein Dimus_038033 [Dionaea muscipula]